MALHGESNPKFKEYLISEMIHKERKNLCHKIRKETGVGLMTAFRCLCRNKWSYELAMNVIDIKQLKL